MGRKSTADRFKRNLIAAGKSSLCITIPAEYLHELGWEKGKELVVKMNKKNRRLIVEEIPDLVIELQ